MLPIALATLMILTPLAAAEPCPPDDPDDPMLRVGDLCVYQVPHPPFVEVRECDPEDQTLKLP